MATKDNLLKVLEKEKGKYYSGEELALALDISRTSVWKAVNALRKDGYNISAVTNKGYCLAEDTDILSQSGIEKYLEAEKSGFDIEVLKETESTNTYLKELAEKGAKEWKVVVSACQTKGKGRLGRRFESPGNTGIYLSILLKPGHIPAQKAGMITTLAAVAVSEAIEEVSDNEALIKWVNDIYINGKKVCGILTEAAFDMENSSLSYAVLGIGINVYEPEGGFDGSIKNIAGAVFEEKVNDIKNKLTALVLTKVKNYYNELVDNEKGKNASFISKYKKKSLVLGKEISVIKHNETKPAKAIDLDDECHLIVEYEDKKREVLASGEISIRVKK